MILEYDLNDRIQISKYLNDQFPILDRPLSLTNSLDLIHDHLN